MEALTCADMGLLSSRALDGDLSAAEARQWSDHLAGCAACRARMAELVGIDALIQELNQRYAGFSLDGGFAQRIAAELAALNPPGRRAAFQADEDLRLFNQRVARDDGLRAQLERANDLESFVRLYVSLGGRHGFRFTEMDLRHRLDRAANDRELDDLELDAVVGGTGLVQQYLDLLLDT